MVAALSPASSDLDETLSPGAYFGFLCLDPNLDSERGNFKLFGRIIYYLYLRKFDFWGPGC